MTLVFSIVAILVSVASFSWGEWKDYSRRGAEDRKQTYLSYQLGVAVGSAVSGPRLQKAVSNQPPDSQAMTLLLASAQGIIDQLDLRVSVKDFRDSRELFIISEQLASRIGVLCSSEAETAFRLGRFLGEAYDLAIWLAFPR